MKEIVPVHIGSGSSNNGGNSDNGNSGEYDGSVETIDRVELPKMYKVMLLNDDFTPMEFVVLVLRRFFAKSEEEATKVMLDVHKKGAGLAGVYTLEMAEMKVMQVNQYSRQNQHPLKCTLEQE